MPHTHSEAAPCPPAAVADLPFAPVAGAETAERTVVLGIGNSLRGDDGFGQHVLNRLIADGLEAAWAGCVDLVDGGTLGYLLLDRLAGATGLIVVDAANLSAPAGELRVFEGAAVDAWLGQSRGTSVHEAGLLDVLRMLTWSELGPRRRALVAVQPARIDWDTELSPAVSPSVAEAAGQVRSILSRWQGEDAP